MPPIYRMTEPEILTIRARMAELLIGKEDAFGSIDPLYPDRLSSAVARQSTAFNNTYKYETVPEIAATLFYGLNMAHAFENGNKRTALVSLLVFLNRNRQLLLNTTEDDLFHLATRVAEHSFPLLDGGNRTTDSEVDAIAGWIAQRCRELSIGDKKLYFSELKRLLGPLGCTFDSPSANYIKIRRGQVATKIGYPKADFEIAVNTVKKIRRDLQLDELHGVDSRGFYDFEAQATRFVNEHRDLMRRLADR